MKDTPSTITEKLQSPVSTLAHCWKVTRRDGFITGFTDHDHDVSVNGITYHAESGFTPSAIANNHALKVDNLTVEGVLDHAHISEEDLLAGAYDYAEITVFQVDYTMPDAGLLHLKTGWIGEVKVESGRFIAQLRGLTQHLNAHAGKLYSPICRAQLGDVQCGLTLTAYTSSGSITSVNSRSTISDSARSEISRTFQHGKITFTSGKNMGIISEIRKHDAHGNFTLLLALPYDCEVGDNYSISQGCDRQFYTCTTRYNNAVNFRGEPHVPGTDALLTTASTAI